MKYSAAAVLIRELEGEMCKSELSGKLGDAGSTKASCDGEAKGTVINLRFGGVRKTSWVIGCINPFGPDWAFCSTSMLAFL